jgi:hypothetical protein
VRVITHPSEQDVIIAGRYDGTVLVARWRDDGCNSLTSFRYHEYIKAWFSVGDEKKHDITDVLKEVTPLALFIDNPE